MSGYRDKRSGNPRGGGHKKEELKPEEIVEMAKKHFGFHYEELLYMEQSSDLDGLDKKLKSFVEKNYGDVTSSQLRNIFGKIKPIDKNKVNKLKMQRPKLHYVIARQNKSRGALNLMYLFDDLIGKVKTEKEVDGFKTLLESVVAYHKYFETVKPCKNKRR